MTFSRFLLFQHKSVKAKKEEIERCVSEGRRRRWDNWRFIDDLWYLEGFFDFSLRWFSQKFLVDFNKIYWRILKIACRHCLLYNTLNSFLWKYPMITFGPWYTSFARFIENLLEISWRLLGFMIFLTFLLDSMNIQDFSNLFLKLLYLLEISSSCFIQFIIFKTFFFEHFFKIFQGFHLFQDFSCLLFLQFHEKTQTLILFENRKGCEWTEYFQQIHVSLDKFLSGINSTQGFC